MLMINIPKSAHAESEISFKNDSIHGTIVCKRYRQDVECVHWLNQHLAQYYDPSHGQPVAQHEFAALHILAPYRFAPKPLTLFHDSIIIEFAGVPLTFTSPISIKEYKKQCHSILNTLVQLDFKHNDLLPRNVLFHQGQIKIIDFTLSEFLGIKIMDTLPNPAWARPGKDTEILKYLSTMRIRHQLRWVHFCTPFLPSNLKRAIRTLLFKFS